MSVPFLHTLNELPSVVVFVQAVESARAFLSAPADFSD